MSKQLADIGKRLTPSLQKDALLKLLKQAAALLTEVEQSPSQGTITAMKPCTEALVLPALLRHKDKDVKLLVATCLSEIMRIVAPEAPYEDDVLKDIFQLIVAIFQGLNDVPSSSFERRVNILETVAKVRSCVVMLDLECDDLILEMFHVFFNTASEEHPQNVFVAMRNILSLVIKESEEVSQPMLEVILTNILKDNKDVSPAAHKLAVAVVDRCADKLEPYVQKFLTSVMLEGKHGESELHQDYHDIIYEIYKCAPQMLLAVIPNLTQELVTDQIDVRLKAVELLGRLFALPGRHVAQEYKQLFSEFLKRFSDKAFEVRLAVVECAKACVEANPTGSEAADILAGLNDRVLDFDERVRMAVVKCLCGLVNDNPKWVPIHMIKRIAERLRDKKFSVREDTLHKLAEVYRTYTTKCNEGLSTIDENFEWIPGKIVRCLYDKDFRPQSIEIVFTDELFKADLPLEQRAKHWIAMYALFDKIDERAFRSILARKQRLQMEMQTYLGLRKKSKEEDSPDVQKKIQASFKAIASSFADPAKAEESLQKVHQIKDNNVFKSLTVLLTPSTPFKQALTTRGELLKRVGEKHPQHDFIKILATKCSYLLFNKEHVKAVLQDLTINKQSGNKEHLAASLSLLVEFAQFFPPLLEGTEGDLLELLKESDETIKEGVVHVLSKAGGAIRNEISTEESSVDLTLEQLCLEGNRKQAKHAVSAIAAISADSGLKALSVLYGRLVDLLEDKIHLPTILQSLGCIAENAIPVFETREEEVVRFVVRNLLKRENVQREGSKPDFDNPSEECLLKIYGVKCLVKSFLPHKDAQLRTAKLKGLLSVMAKLLITGEVSDDIKSSDTDRANLRLAAGKGVLRLARRWDSQISPAIVHSTLALAHDPSIEVRHKFFNKVHQYLKERMLHQKYACVFAHVAVDSSRDIVSDGRRYLADFVDSSRREAKSKQVSISAQIEGTTITQHPEYVLTYLVHVLAHQPNFPTEASADTSAYEPTYKQLLVYLRALVHQDGSDQGKKEDVDNLPAILATFRTIKAAEDLVDKDKTERLYAICDIGIVITKELGKKKHFSGEYPGVIPLPSALYKAAEVAAEDEGTSKAKIDGSHLPACFVDSDVLTRFRTIGAATKAGQPSSPRGSKRDRRTLDGDSSSDEGDKDEEGDANAKKAKQDGAVDAGASEGAKGKVESAGAPAAKEPRGRKKVNGDAHKNGMVKASKEATKEEEIASPKRKRGRPKGATNKATSISAVAKDSVPSGRKQEDPADKVKGKKAMTEKAASKADNPSSPKQSSESGRKGLGRNLKITGVDSPKVDAAETSKSGREKRSAEAMRSPIGTPRRLPLKQKPNVPEKSPAAKDSAQLKEEELIGCKIKVFWPLDKRFYKGMVAGYDARKGRHKILYDDGEVEQLLLSNERWDVVDSSKAQGRRVAVEDPSPAPPSGSQSGKLKRKAKAQTVDNGSQSSEPSDKKRAITKTSAKEASAQTLQGVGRGLAQARSRPITSPPPKSSKNATNVSASPFEFNDDDFPANEKGSKAQKGSSSEVSQKAGTRMTFRVKRNTERDSKDNKGKQKEKSAEKVEAEKPKGRMEKGRESQNSKTKGKSDSSKDKSDVEKRKTANSESRREERAANRRSHSDAEASKDTEKEGMKSKLKSKSKDGDVVMKEKASSNLETSKRKGRNEKSRASVAKGAEEPQDEAANADSDKSLSKPIDKKQKLRDENDGSEGTVQDTSGQEEGHAEQSKARSKKDSEGTEKDAELTEEAQKSTEDSKETGNMVESTWEADEATEADKKASIEAKEPENDMAEAEMKSGTEAKEADTTEADKTVTNEGREAGRKGKGAETKKTEVATGADKEMKETEKAVEKESENKLTKEVEEVAKVTKDTEKEVTAAAVREAEKVTSEAEKKITKAAESEAEKVAKEAEKKVLNAVEKVAEKVVKEAEKKVTKAAEKEAEKVIKEAEKKVTRAAEKEAEKVAKPVEADKVTKEAEKKVTRAAEKEADKVTKETEKKVTRAAEKEADKVTKEVEKKVTRAAEKEAEKVTKEAEKKGTRAAEKESEKVTKEAEKKVTRAAGKEADKVTKETDKKVTRAAEKEAEKATKEEKKVTRAVEKEAEKATKDAEKTVTKEAEKVAEKVSKEAEKKATKPAEKEAEKASRGAEKKITRAAVKEAERVKDVGQTATKEAEKETKGTEKVVEIESAKDVRSEKSESKASEIATDSSAKNDVSSSHKTDRVENERAESAAEAGGATDVEIGIGNSAAEKSASVAGASETGITKSKEDVGQKETKVSKKDATAARKDSAGAKDAGEEHSVKD